jgi:hypothetical protein
MRIVNRLMYTLGKFMLFNGKQRRFRHGVVFFLTNLFVLSGVVFVGELVLIFLGVGDIALPLTQSAQDFLTNLFF